MKIIHLKKIKKEKWISPLFTDTVTKQTPVGEKDGADLSIDYVHFPKGVRNKFHKHSNDQVLIITEDKGIVATRKKDKKPFVGEIKNKRKNGEIYTAIARISPILDKDQQLIGFVGTEEDITERVIFEDNLRELYNAKTQFFALSPHQLRTPQGIIKWSMELLLGDKDFHLNPRQMQLLNQIAKANKQMIDLIDTLLKITRTNLEKDTNNTKQAKKLKARP